MPDPRHVRLIRGERRDRDVGDGAFAEEIGATQPGRGGRRGDDPVTQESLLCRVADRRGRQRTAWQQGMAAVFPQSHRSLAWANAIVILVPCKFKAIVGDQVGTLQAEVRCQGGLSAAAEADECDRSAFNLYTTGVENRQMKHAEYGWQDLVAEQVLQCRFAGSSDWPAFSCARFRNQEICQAWKSHQIMRLLAMDLAPQAIVRQPPLYECVRGLWCLLGRCSEGEQWTHKQLQCATEITCWRKT